MLFLKLTNMDYKNKIEYIVIFISEFANYYKLSLQESYRYLRKHNALSFLEEQYEIAHTMSYKYMIESMSAFCKRNGGNL